MSVNINTARITGTMLTIIALADGRNSSRCKW